MSCINPTLLVLCVSASSTTRSWVVFRMSNGVSVQSSVWSYLQVCQADGVTSLDRPIQGAHEQPAVVEGRQPQERRQAVQV